MDQRRIFEGLMMFDLNKERELCNQSFEKYWDDFCEAYGNGFDRSLAKLFFANAWGEAKAQAVPDTPTPSVTLTCAELKEAFDFGAPDGEKDQFQMETEMTIKWLQDGYDGEGYYCWYADLPEEGCIKLGVSESGAEG